MNKISIKGVLIGGIAYFVATNIFALPLLMYVMVRYGVFRMPPDQMGAATIAALHSNAVIYGVGLLIGSSCTVLGGYLAARIAKRGECVNGALSCLIPNITSSAYLLLRGTVSMSVSEQLLWLILSPLFGLLGGYLRLKQIDANGPAIAPSRKEMVR